MPSPHFIKKMADEPFRLFFILGTLAGLLGVLYWPLSIYQLAFTNLPMDFHVWMQIYGFLWSFVVGFLATALPRLTETRHFTIGETGTLFVLIVTGLWGLLINLESVAHGSFLLSLMIFVTFLWPRFRKRKRSPPPTFVFIPFAFLSAIIGAALLIYFQFGGNFEFSSLYPLGRNLVTQGFVTFLLIGIGGFLIRSILGWGGFLPTPDAPPKKPLASALAPQALIAILVFGSYVWEAFSPSHLPKFLRAALITGEFFVQIRIHKWPVSGKLTARTLLISLWVFVIGLWGYAAFAPSRRLAFLHLIFIGGFALATLAVATRVIFSHCNRSDLLNTPHRPFTIAAILLLIGLAARFVSDFLPASQSGHLAFAGIFLGLALIVWGSSAIKQLIKNTFQNKK